MTESNNNETMTKGEFFKEINDFQEKWMKMLDMKELKIKKEITNIQENSSNLLQKSKILIDNYSTEKIKDSKLNELEAFKNKVNDMLLTHEIRINNNTKDLSNFTNKYEKIITENILVPGFVGPSCQFKTLSEYINYNISEVAKIKSEKDFVKKDQKESRAKLESFMKQMLLLNESTMTQTRELINGKQKDYILLIDGKMQPLNDKVFKFYETSLQLQSKVEKEIKGFKEDIGRILKLKEEIIEIIKEKEIKFQIILDEINNKVTNNIQNIEINKNEITEIKEKINKINDNYNKLNIRLNDISKEMNNINNNISFKNNKNLDIRNSVSNFNSFMNKLNKNKPSFNSSTKDKSLNINRTDKSGNVTLREEKEEEEKYDDNNILKETKDVSININEDNTRMDGKEKEVRKKYGMNDKQNSLKNKMESQNEIEKSKYKTFYNKMTKDKEDDAIFETFYMGKTKIPIIKPFLLDQRILRDEEIRRYFREKQEKKKEKIKITKIRNNFLDYELSAKDNKTNYTLKKGKNLDINYYKLSIPKLTSNQKSEDKLLNPNNYEKKLIKKSNYETKLKNALSKEKMLYKINLNSINDKKYLNLINLKLDDSVAINPETNNGAYILAKKLLENNKMSRVDLTPTSYMYLNHASKEGKTSKLVSMTFMREEQKTLNSLSNTLENEDIRMKLELSDMYKNVRIMKEN